MPPVGPLWGRLTRSLGPTRAVMISQCQLQAVIALPPAFQLIPPWCSRDQQSQALTSALLTLSPVASHSNTCGCSFHSFTGVYATILYSSNQVFLIIGPKKGH